MNQLISEITSDDDVDEDKDRPDISMVFSADPEVEEKVDVVVVELKKRTADDKEGLYAANQLMKRAEKLVTHCPNIQRIWYFGVIEIDDAMSKMLINMKWTPLFSKGRVFYNDFQIQRDDAPAVPTPVCLMSFDAIIKDAAARNHTFLEILKSDMKRVLEVQTNDAQ